jgi:vitamin B12 transporter
VADLLRNNGCAEMVRNGGAASTTSLFLRGADTRHTLVLVDGVRMDSQSTGGASWQGIPVAQVERVEVLKGPASAIYGSDAVGGVVQIFTRKGGGKVSADFGVGLGTQGTMKADGGLFGSQGIIDFAFTGAIEESDGFNSTIDYPGSFSYVPDRDGWRKYQGTARVGAQLAEGHRAELIVIKNHINGQYDASKSKPLADQISPGALLVGFAWCFVAVALAALALDTLNLIVAFSFAVIALLWMGRMFKRRLQGFTGDCLGATQQVCEIAFYFGLAISL